MFRTFVCPSCGAADAYFSEDSDVDSSAANHSASTATNNNVVVGNAFDNSVDVRRIARRRERRRLRAANEQLRARLRVRYPLLVRLLTRDFDFCLRVCSFFCSLLCCRRFVLSLSHRAASKWDAKRRRRVLVDPRALPPLASLVAASSSSTAVASSTSRRTDYYLVLLLFCLVASDFVSDLFVVNLGNSTNRSSRCERSRSLLCFCDRLVRCSNSASCAAAIFTVGNACAIVQSTDFLL
jgi:hypothetical protein